MCARGSPWECTHPPQRIQGPGRRWVHPPTKADPGSGLGVHPPTLVDPGSGQRVAPTHRGGSVLVWRRSPGALPVESLQDCSSLTTILTCLQLQVTQILERVYLFQVGGQTTRSTSKTVHSKIVSGWERLCSVFVLVRGTLEPSTRPVFPQEAPPVARWGIPVGADPLLPHL